MLNHSLVSVLRTSTFRPLALTALTADNAARRFGYENIKVRKIKYKSQAKERRKIMLRNRMGANQGPRELGEEQPPFFMPVRYKLFAKCFQEFRNSNRFSRKPMPEEVRLELCKRSREYNMYKHHEVQMIEREANDHVKAQMSALEACLFLPDYLMDETLNETGAQQSEAMEEFMPGVLYMEQVLRMFPREYANRLRMLPAWEESLMKYDESKGDGKAK